MRERTKKILAVILCMTMLITSMGVISFADIQAETTPEVTQEVTPEVTVEPTEEPDEEDPIVQTVAPKIASVQLITTELAISAQIDWTCDPSDEEGTLNYLVRFWEGNTDYDEQTTVNMASVTDPAASEIIVDGIIKSGTYSYQIGAFLVGDATNTIAWSARSSFVADDNLVAAVVTSVKGGTSKDNLITVTFDEGSGAGKYVLISGKKESSMKPVDTKYVVSNGSGKIVYHQQCKGKMYYAVRAYSLVSSTLSADSNAMQGGTVGDRLVFGTISKLKWRATTKKKATLYKKSTGSAKIKTIKKGVKATAIGYYPNPIKEYGIPSRIKIRLTDGTEGWVKYSYVSIKALTKIKYDYPTSVKEEFANQYSSKTSYLIWVNQYTQRCTIFKKNDKGKFKIISNRNGVRVSTGKYYQPLKNGTSYVLKGHKYRVDRLQTDLIVPRPYYFNYATYFGGSGYFHTRSIWSDTLTYRNSVNGRLTTRGCCRMNNSDAIYIYNLPLKTRVIIR